LSINGVSYPAVPMPYDLAARLYVVRLLRVPERFNIFLALPIAMLVANGSAYLLSRLQRGKVWGATVLLCLSAAVLFEYLTIPMLLQPSRVSEFYARLAAEPGDFAILNVPVDPYNSKPFMFEQTVHGHPILQGHSSRYPKGAFSYLDSQPWINAIRRAQQVPPKQTDIVRQLAALADEDIRYLIVHKDQIGSDDWARWRRYLAIEPRFEDEDIAAYATTPVAGRDVVLASEIGSGIGILRAIPSPDCLAPGQTLELDVAWGTVAPPGRDLYTRLALLSPDGAERQAQSFPVASDWPTGQWPAGAVAWGIYTLPVSATLSAGTYDVALTLIDEGTDSAIGPAVPVSQVRIDTAPCTFAAPPGAEHAGALFGDAMRLLGYRLQQDDRSLEVTLYWRAERRMATDYKVFVHVYDRATRIPVAQDDAMPLRWRYPTTLWVAGEGITDTVPISLAGVPAGQYGLAVGVYNPVDMEILPAHDDESR
jgi:hypothetical protein